MDDGARTFEQGAGKQADPEEFARQALNELRLERGWTYSDMARRLDTTPTQIRKLELGDLKLSLTWIHRLADIFGVTMSRFLPPTEVDMPIDSPTAELMSIVADLRAPDRKLVAEIAKQLLALSRRIAPNADGPILHGDRHLAEQVAGVWDRWNPLQRQRAVDLLLAADAAARPG